ncbi:peroxisomal membrane protein PEX13-like [Daphnia pulex]|uniref:peroxisomal membrane protein PEX13-like n=1 Tax=Daphnia pulex TaxID=6669 RepID=UPI001EE0D7B1|nr:peroxisomal membrane protein PEX13-like [Daphnia pulex]
MAAPLKPWERAGVNSRAFGGDIGNTLPTPIVSGGGGSAFTASGPGVPPLPPRVPGANPTNNDYGAVSSYSPYRTGISSYSSPYGYSSGYGGYSGLSSGYGTSYGGYGNSYGGYGSYNSYGGRSYGGTSDNRFISMAEESSQPAFQSLESIVHAFSSISMMLDSTLNAVYSSFRAVLGMADQFSRMRTHLSKVFSALAIFRTAKWALHKLFYIFGLRRENPINTAWSTAVSNSDALSAGLLTEADIKKSRSSWPITLFLAIIISAPYFIWRIISSLDSAPDALGKKWADGLGEYYTAQADYDFNAGNEQELSFRAGQSLRLAPRSLQPRIKGWMLAGTDSQHTGLVPANYIKILAKHESSTPK